jgi:ubiquinone/menaquinone biosynthesis C-methylase UbiE
MLMRIVHQAEQDRLDMQHAAMLHLLGGNLYLAPVKDPKFVLDVATGTGIWALEFGASVSVSLRLHVNWL